MKKICVEIKTLVSGKYLPEDLRIFTKESNRKIEPSVESKIQLIWEEKESKAKEEGKRLYNGTLYRLNKLENIDNKLHIELGTIEFKTFLCINEIPKYFELGEEYYKNSGHTLSTVKTKDNRYVMVNLLGKSMNENKFEFIGGAMETNIEINNGTNLFESFYAELEEEASIEQRDIKESYLKLIYQKHKTNIGFYFEVILNLTEKELKNKFNSNKKDQDIESLIFFTKDEYVKALENFNVNKKFISTKVEI
jgi:hypothetical protein